MDLTNIRRLVALPVGLYILLGAYVVLSYASLGLSAAYFDTLICEDCYFEMVGAGGFGVAALLFFLAYLLCRTAPHRSRHAPWKRRFFLFLALMFFVGAGEEISWGQRFFDIDTPEAYKEINVQNELNLHNLAFLEGEGSSWWTSADSWFAIFYAVYCVLIPGLAAVSPPARAWLERLMPLVPLSLGLLFVVNFGVSKVSKWSLQSLPEYYDSIYPLRHSVVEIKESNLGLLFAVIALYFYVELLKGRRSSPSGAAAATQGLN